MSSNITEGIVNRVSALMKKTARATGKKADFKNCATQILRECKLEVSEENFQEIGRILGARGNRKQADMRKQGILPDKKSRKKKTVRRFRETLFPL